MPRQASPLTPADTAGSRTRKELTIMDEITSGDSGQVLAWLEARGVGDAVARYAIDEAQNCDLGAECPDECGALDDYTVTFDPGAGTWTARSSSAPLPMDTWTVFASSGEHSYTAPSAVHALTVHDANRPDDFVQAMINDAFPAQVIIAHLNGSPNRAADAGGALDRWTVLTFSGEYAYTAPSAALAVAWHRLKHPSAPARAVINNEYPAEVITANLIASQ